MKKTIKNLKLLFFIPIILVLIIIIAFESGLLPVGIFPPHGVSEFYLLMLMELLMVALIPLSLRLFKFKIITEELSEKKEKALAKWWSIRILMLLIPLAANAILYYLYMSTTFGYMAIILAICLVFVYPDTDKCYYETRNREE